MCDPHPKCDCSRRVEELERKLRQTREDRSFQRKALTSDVDRHVATVEVQIKRCEALEATLRKISAIRDSIVGLQTINWSEHIYPLVAALKESGFEGTSYEIAKENVGTLLEQIAELEKSQLTSEDKALRIALQTWLDTPEDEDPGIADYRKDQAVIAWGKARGGTRADSQEADERAS